MKSQFPRIQKVIDKLDEVSPSFCVAKWKQVTLHLQNGHNHSCHHPGTHHVSVEELKRNYKALHNSDYKKQQRKMMLEGKRPPECNYCWNIEDSAPDSTSDRAWKSASNWALPYVEEIISKKWSDDIDPSYLEVSFGNVCNFKCSYCAPHISSQWMEEIERFGPYPGSDFGNLDWIEHQKLIPIPNREENPYVEAFWEWFPDLHKTLKHFRVTGGEPLLNKNLFKVFDYIKQNPNPELSFDINSNLCVTEEIFEKFLKEVKFITENNLIKQMKIFTSAEAYGEQCNYIRNGMDYDLWKKNTKRLLEEVPQVDLTLMSTYNLLSVFSYTDFLKDILELKNDFIWTNNEKTTGPRIILSIPYLNHPKHQSMLLLEKQYISKVQESVDFISNNIRDVGDRKNGGFEIFELEQMKRILELIQNHQHTDEDEVHRKHFVMFVDEHDKRRNTNFKKTFPEFISSYEKWVNI